jgi:hypothetical protein
MSSPAAFLEGQPAGLHVIASGTATIAIDAFQSAEIVVAGLTTNAVILCWGIGASQLVANATSFSANIAAAGAFRVSADAVVAGAAKAVGWAVLRM